MQCRFLAQGESFPIGWNADCDLMCAPQIDASRWCLSLLVLRSYHVTIWVLMLLMLTHVIWTWKRLLDEFWTNEYASTCPIAFWQIGEHELYNEACRNLAVDIFCEPFYYGRVLEEQMHGMQAKACRPGAISELQQLLSFYWWLEEPSKSSDEGSLVGNWRRNDAAIFTKRWLWAIQILQRY